MKKSKFMFIISLKKIKKIVIGSFIVSVLGSSVLFVCSNKADTPCSNNKLNISANDNNSRVLFLKDYGLEVKSDPVEEIEIKIPSTFNETFSAYNEIQKSQGFDLHKYKGKTCNKYVYEVLNYKDCAGTVKASVLIYKDKIIAGDIYKSGHDGFIKSIVINK